MKKVLLILGFLVLAGTLPSGSARADGKTSSGVPWNSPIIVGDPQLNREVRRPGPYTPKPKPSSFAPSELAGNNQDAESLMF